MACSGCIESVCQDPPSSSSMSRVSRKPAQPKAPGAWSVLVLDVLVDFFAVPEYNRDRKSWCPVGQFVGPLTHRKVTLFSNLTEKSLGSSSNESLFLSSRIFSKNIGTILFASFLLTLITLRLNCSFCNITFSGNSHRRNTVHSTSQSTCLFAGFLDHPWECVCVCYKSDTQRDLCFRDVCYFSNT